MPDDDKVNFGTRRLDLDENNLAVQPDSQTEPVEHALPWVIELRIVGTASVLQVRVQGELIIGRSDPRFKSKP
ncbi:MAG TPA: hypothetical protein VHL11_21990, partial [Phototrophicaceae bacterium]|nr:hypothetical protein [Phototrophicaceae bacterium]